MTDTCRRCKGTGVVTEYHHPLDFNPHSSKQVLQLIQHFGLKMPRKRGEDRETTEARFLRRFSTAARRSGETKEDAAARQAVFSSILRCRERQKLVSTYMWPLDAAGRVHTTYGWTPTTWRKSSRNVNLQNIPKRSALAKQFRRLLVASPGCLLVEADAEGIEAVLVGYCAGSEEYIRIAKAGLHGFMAAVLAGKPIPYDLPPEELRRRTKEAKQAWPGFYDVAKRGNHAINYLLSAHGLHDEYAEQFPTHRSAKEYIELYFSMPFGPAIRKWQQQTCDRAHRETYLENHWRYRHYFYDVYTWDKRTAAWRIGEDAKRAVAFVPQSDASAVQSDVLLRLAAQGEEVLGWLRLIVHDSIILEVPESALDRAAALLHAEMTRPVPELGGLSIGAEVTWGRNLAPVAEDNPEGMRPYGRA